jgi:predicted RNase H-like HicB family nuclease
MDKYLIVLEKTSTGFSVYSPDVLGCIATGDTIDDALFNMKSALRLHLKAILEDGESIPIPKGIESYLEAARESDGEDYFMTHIPMNELLAMQYS